MASPRNLGRRGEFGRGAREGVCGQIFVLDLALFASSNSQSVPTDFGHSSEVSESLPHDTHRAVINTHQFPNPPSDSSPRGDRACPLKLPAQSLYIPFLVTRPFSP